VKNTYQIVDISENEINAVHLMCNDELGEDYITETFLTDSITNNHQIVRVAINENKEVIGFSIASIYSENELKKYLNDKRCVELILPDLTNQKIGITKIVVIKDQYKKNGIGIDLLNDSLLLIEEKKVAIMIGFAWKSKEGVNAKRILEKNGFQELIEVKKFWNDESLKENYSCPDCGNPPCVCSAIIFMKKLKNAGGFDSAQPPAQY
jgi:hypothetical protein